MKDENLLIRLTAEEKEIIRTRAEAAGKTMSAYAVEVLLVGKVTDYSPLKKIYPQLMRIGNNINQAVRIMNMYHSEDGSEFTFVYEEFLKLVNLLESHLRL